ncbi:MAG: glycosyltransferase [Rhodothermia bacterium]|nr:glycosyltransferase [Rhodothermia bacterium]
MRLVLIGMATEPHFQKWLPALVEQGVEVHLVSYHALEVSIKGVIYHQIKSPFGLKTGFWSYHLFSVAPFRSLLDEIKPDVLVGSFATHYGWIAARTGFAPLVLMTWTRDTTVHPFEGWLKKYYHSVVSRAMKQAKLIVTDGPALAKMAQENFPKYAHKITPLLWGIRLADYVPPQADNALLREKWGVPSGKKVLTCGRGVYFYYQPELFLAAALQLLETRDDIFIIVLTLGQERTEKVDKLLKRIEKHPSGMVIPMRLPLVEVREIWTISDLMLSCPEYDGISEAVLECMVAGAIPILNPIPSNQLLVNFGVSAFIVNDDSLTSFCTDLNRVLDNAPKTLLAMRTKNQAFVHKHASIEATALSFKHMLKHLVTDFSGKATSTP